MLKPLMRVLDRLAPPSDGTGPAAAREALGLSAGLVVVLAVSKPLLDGALGLPGAAFTLAAAWQLFLPLDRLDARRVDPATFGIHAHGLISVPLRRFQLLMDRVFRRGALRSVGRGVAAMVRPYARVRRVAWRGAARDLGLCAAASILTFPVFGVCYVIFQDLLAQQRGSHAVFHFTLPPDLLSLLATHILLVGLVEELFYRGYIHTLLVRAWPPGFTIAGASVGKAVLVGSALFALGHFAGEWNPLRLGPFFPALLFCALRSWSGSILGAVIYHGLSNVVGEVMRVSVTLH